MIVSFEGILARKTYYFTRLVWAGMEYFWTDLVSQDREEAMVFSETDARIILDFLGRKSYAITNVQITPVVSYPVDIDF